jgi:hypothetical protein
MQVLTIDKLFDRQFVLRQGRYTPLEDKLCGALPEFFNVKSLKLVNGLWQRFCQLRSIRHFAVHPKLEVQQNPKERTLEVVGRF